MKADPAFRKLVRDLEEAQKENAALRVEIDRLTEVGVEEREAARDLAFEEAARVAEATGEELERLGANSGYGDTFASAIRSLKRGGK